MIIIKILITLLPWRIRRLALNYLFKFEINSSATIGLAWVFPQKLIMEAGSKIDHFTVAINLDQIKMGKDSKIGRSNWITGFSTKHKSTHFKHQPDRKAELFIGESASITKNHHIDCTNRIEIGPFATVAGYQSQLLTHSINITENRQDSKPIIIGSYSFIGTNSVILGGAVLPSYSVLGAKSLLNKPYSTEYMLYAGVPAKQINKIPKEAEYFNRTDGFVL
jgi:acetyltransferase-like isoleucine patch superfamily enzyme